MKSFTVVALFLLCAVLPGCETQRHGTRAGGTGRIALNASCVPAGLRDLVPLAARWGVTDPEVRDEIEKEMTAAQAGEVRDAVHSRAPEIRAWLGTALPLGACADEAAAFGGLLALYDDVSDIQLMRGLR
ncbi:MAG TPA: hypothetical protein PK307_02990 [Spirochaetota bacterium]|nr:hypothetical protein [Spirochaetota bacterium]HOD13944.1 hypothetical protein [Spirochaetota bacterium]HPG49750.1 hypothetical protein [Spirochaetota bacterium]HPN11907.1 hypothetical protein [Spirochaetota bacterium]HQL81140.1 hypothetical protein [Spirochaetota bacterium]